MWLVLAMTALATPPPGRVSAARFGPEHGLPGAQVRALALEDAGTLLVGTEAGACRFDGQRCVDLPAPEGLEGAFVSGLTARGARAWVSTALGVYRVEGEQATLLDTHVLSVFRSDFVEGPDGALLLVDEAGVWRVEEAGLAPLVGPELGWGWEAALHEGRLYLGGPDGLFVVEGEALQPLGEAPVRGLLSTAAGLLVGTDQGLRDVDGQPLSGGTDCFVTDLTRLPEGRRVVACGRGVQVEAEGGGWEPIDEESGLPTAIVLQAVVDRDGQLWLGSLDQGLIRVAEPDARLWDLSTGLPSPHITALARQGEDLLVATRRGGVRLSPDQQWRLEQPGELRGVAVDAAGQALWLDAQARLQRADAAPYQAGEALGMLHALPGGRLLHHAHEAAWLLDPTRASAPLARFPLPQDVIDASGVLDGEAFYAVGVEGLWRVDAEGFTRVGEGPGRCGGSIAGLGARGLYAACDARLFLRADAGWRALPSSGEAIKGLSRSGEELWLSSLTALRRLEPTPLRLDAGSGLPAVSFTGASGPKRWGEWLVAPTGQGLLFVRPEALGRAREAPRPRIRGVYVGDLELEDLSQLKPGDRLLRLTLGSDSLVDPAALRHRFRLDGGEWSPAFSGETLHLPGLAHGPHALEVQVAFLGGPWSEAAALDFTLPPQWHQRRDVQGAALLTLLALLGWVWRERDRRLTEQLRRLEERESFRQVFGRFVDPRVAERALAGTLSREGERREVTVLFADLRGFTPLSEALPPRQLVALLNAWLTAMVEQVEAEGGVVNKFAGDAIVAIFGAPLTQEDHADRALRAAGAMRAATHALNADIQRRFGHTIAAGVGLNSGEVIAGPIGAESRMEYTVIGEAVNVAARVEALTRALEVEVLITEATRARLSGAFPLEAKGAHRLKGVGEAVEVWALAEESPPRGA